MENKSEQAEDVVRGTVKRVIFRNPDNGYSVLQLEVADERQHLVVVGSCLNVSIGTNILARGSYQNHSKYGRQFVAQQLTEVEPETVAGIEKYIGSGKIKGIGPKTAALLVEAFGTETLQVIYREPEKLAEVRGIGRHKAKLLQAAFAEQSGLEEVQRFFIEHNISIALTGKIYEKYGLEAVHKISKDPYLLAYEIKGIGFATADSIALNLGLQMDSPQRLRAGLYWALDKAAEEGHCFLEQEVLITRTRELLKLSNNYDFVAHLEDLGKGELIVIEQNRIYLSSLYWAEQFVADFISARSRPAPSPGPGGETIDKALTASQQSLGIKFSYEQKQAVRLACQYPLLLITGGPGCGKTTIIRALSSLYKNAGKALVLAAPTGKAAQRMSEICERPASTIHRLLKYDPLTQKFFYGLKSPLKISPDSDRFVDAVIIDEASMIDIQLARSLFAAIPEQATLILVGDKDQLPSVGPGKIFADLLSIKELKMISLSRLFRRSQQSRINTIAHMINSGIVPDIPRPDGITKTDAYFIEKQDVEAIASLVETLVVDQLPKKFGFSKEDITVLTPSNRGPLGTIELNSRLQNKLNPADHPEDIFQLGHTEFRVGDRVCQRKNNYRIDEFGVFNGDIGHIYSIDHNKEELVVDLWDGRLVKYQKADARELSLAYTLTVHRSQGSEIPCVVLVLHDSHFILLERQLFYTAVTRAKQLLVVVGTKKALSIASKTLSAKRRCTNLREKISEKLKVT